VTSTHDLSPARDKLAAEAARAADAAEVARAAEAAGTGKAAAASAVPGPRTVPAPRPATDPLPAPAAPLRTPLRTPRPVVRAVWDVLSRLAGLVLLILLSPVLGAIALWIRIADGPGVFFVQDRPFPMYKFRTMVHDATSLSAGFGLKDPYGLLEDDPRITRCGRLLRRTSLDELPQLLNIARGEMTLVGPRPDVMLHVVEYSVADARRLAVKPGVTGWSQINGRNTISWPERFVLDAWYVDHWSPALDLKILWRTAAAVLRDELDSPWARSPEFQDPGPDAQR
jgi:lipopolysaccharide/colanic/teichoic acid biosynthesis glycosyltransferase